MVLSIERKALKSLRIAPEIERDQQLGDHVRYATDLLIDELGRSADLAEAEWIAVPGDRPRVRLTLASFGGSLSADFSADDLRDEAQLRRRLSGLWGDLLRERSHAQLQRVHQVVQELEGD